MLIVVDAFLVVHRLRDVDEHVAAALHDVAVAIAGIALACTVDAFHQVILVCSQRIGQRRPEIDEGMRHAGLAIAFLGRAIVIEIGAILWIRIVIGTEAAPEDGIGTALQVLHIGRGLQQVLIFYEATGIKVIVVAGGAHTAREVALSQDASSQVIAAIDDVTDIGEAFAHGPGGGVYLTADVGLGVAQDVGHTGAGEGVEHAALAQVDGGVATDGAEEAATVDELRLGHGLALVVLFRHARIVTAEIDRAAVLGVVLILLFVEIIGAAAGYRTPDDALLAAAEDLEGVATGQIDGGAAPYLGVLTLAAAEHVEGCTLHVHALLTEDHAGATLLDGICNIALVK